MSDERELKFMWNKLQLPRMYMAEWFRVQDFTDAMLRKVEKREDVDVTTVLPVMEEIFDSILTGRITVDDSVRIRVLRQGINRMRRAYMQILHEDDQEGGV